MDKKHRKTTAKVMYSPKLVFAIPLPHKYAGKNAPGGSYAARRHCPVGYGHCSSVT